MGIARFRSAFRRSVTTEEAASPVAVSSDNDFKGEFKGEPTETIATANEDNPEVPTEDTQRGVRDVEAVTLSWTKGMLIAVFVK
jgi:hypothetical protein